MSAPTLLQELHLPGRINVKVLQFVEDTEKLNRLKRILKKKGRDWKKGWSTGTTTKTKKKHRHGDIQEDDHEVHELVKDIKEYCGANKKWDDYILLNRYEYAVVPDNPEATNLQIYPHQDQEFGHYGTIAGFSLGEMSTLRFCSVDPSTGEDVYDFDLPAGSVYIK